MQKGAVVTLEMYGVTEPIFIKFVKDVGKILPLNNFESKRRYCNPFWNAAVPNERIVADSEHRLVVAGRRRDHVSHSHRTGSSRYSPTAASTVQQLSTHRDNCSVSLMSLLVVHSTSHFTDCLSHRRRRSILCCHDLLVSWKQSVLRHRSGPVPKVNYSCSPKTVKSEVTC